MDLSMGLIRAEIDTLEKYQSLKDKWYHSLKKQGIK